MSLIAKNRLKMIEFSSSLQEKEIHMFDSPFKEDFKNIIFFREALISRERRKENLGKMGNNRDIYGYANQGGAQFQKRISVPYHLVPKPL